MNRLLKFVQLLPQQRMGIRDTAGTLELTLQKVNNVSRVRRAQQLRRRAIGEKQDEAFEYHGKQLRKLVLQEGNTNM